MTLLSCNYSIIYLETSVAFRGVLPGTIPSHLRHLLRIGRFAFAQLHHPLLGRESGQPFRVCPHRVPFLFRRGFVTGDIVGSGNGFVILNVLLHPNCARRRRSHRLPPQLWRRSSCLVTRFRGFHEIERYSWEGLGWNNRLKVQKSAGVTR